MYRRRRLAVLCAGLSLFLLPAAVVVASASGSANHPAGHTIVPAAGASNPGPVYVVQPGDTLWTIARKVDPAGDTRETVDRLVDLNGGASLQPGQRLRLTADH